MGKRNKRGNIAIEAAIVLPMVILGILTLAYMIKINTLEESCSSIATDELRLISMQSYTDLGKIESVFFPKKLEARLKEYQPIGSDIEISDFKYLYKAGKKDNLISFKYEYGVSLNFPISFYDRVQGENYFIGRAFVGTNKYDTENGFTEMELTEESEPVFVFPVAGEKYHDGDCTYVKSSTRRALLSKGMKKKYKTCSLCNSEKLKEGCIILYFPKSGGAYHDAKCPTVDKYVVEIEKKEAIERGYRPCSKCGG